MKTHSLLSIKKNGLLKRPDGLPYTSDEGIKRRLEQFGIKKDKTDYRGLKIYAVSEADLRKMNKHYE